MTLRDCNGCFVGLGAEPLESLKIKTGKQVRQFVMLSGHVPGSDDEVVGDSGPCDASHEWHDVSGRGAAFVDNVHHCLVVTHDGDALAGPVSSPDETGHRHWVDLVQRYRCFKPAKSGWPVAGEPLALIEPPKTHRSRRICE